jgi:PIN domain nuclease of toxin-antitoxin system
MILLDTHVLLWFREGSTKLGRSARSHLMRTAAANRLLYSAISLLEICQHVERGKVELDEPIEVWRQHLLDDGISEISVNGAIAIRASELSGMPGDPYDRIIAATAERAGTALMTADRAILEWRGSLKRFDARE